MYIKDELFKFGPETLQTTSLLLSAFARGRCWRLETGLIG
jgi:hypothetical protein